MVEGFSDLEFPDNLFVFLGLLVMVCGGLFFWFWFFGFFGHFWVS